MGPLDNPGNASVSLMSELVPSIWQVTSSKSWGGRESLPVDMHFAFGERGFTSRLFCAEGSAIAARFGSRQGVIVLPYSGNIDRHCLRVLRRYLTEDRPTVIISHYSHDLFLLRRLLLRTKDSRLVLVKHVGPGKPKKDLFHRWIYRRVDLLLGVSRYIVERCRQSYPIPEWRMKVWHPGIPETRLATQPQAREKIRNAHGLGGDDILIGYIARLTPGKGHKELIHAFTVLAAERPNVYLALIGAASPDEQYYMRELRHLAATARLHERIIQPGFVENVADWLAACDIFANPSPKEAFGLNTIEAMAAGLPIVATTGGGTPDIIVDGKNGLLVEPQDIKHLAAVLGRLFGQPDLRLQLGRVARQDFVKYFTLQSALDRLCNVLFNSLSER